VNVRVAALGVLAAGLFVQPVGAKPAPPPPPFEGAYQPRGIEEIGQWREDDESERELGASNLVIRDEALNAYVRKALCEAVGEERCKAVRLYIMREPSFNASMTANGTMRVLSGLFLRVHSEAELAAVLGHEFGHFEKRHIVERFKAQRSGTDLLAWGAVLASMAPTYDTRRAYSDLNVSIYGTLFRYKRDQEREADLLGIGYLNRSELRPQSASQVWKNLMAEGEASARVKGLNKPNFNAIAFTASHPPDGERAAYLDALAEPNAASRDDGAERYRQALAKWLPIFLDDQIKLNDFGGSEYLIQSLSQSGWTAWLWCARGELYRGRGNPRDLVNAAEFYTNAIGLDATLPEAYRGLGLSLLKTGQVSEGQAALRKYLELKPSASDAKLIAMMIPKEAPAQ
jgi:beta-barrel assembly-enhancing protease